MNLAFGLLGLALVLLAPARNRAPTTAGGSLPLALDLVAAALRAGQTVPSALEAAAPAAPIAAAGELRSVAVLLRLGADPAEAWSAVAGAQVAELGRIAARSGVSGARLAEACGQYAMRLRRAASADDEARASRAAVRCAAPLAACFLPSFVCLGVVPAVVGLATAALRAV